MADTKRALARAFLASVSIALFVPNAAHADGAPPSPGKAGAPIVVDVAAEAASVELPGVEARLVAVVAPSSGVFTVKGPAYASNAITGLSAALINQYLAEGVRQGAFGVAVELRRQSGYTDLLELSAFGNPKQGPQLVSAKSGRVSGEDIDSATTFFALLELTLRAAPQSQKFDLATTVVYGPAFEESLDIRVDAANAPAQFMGMKVTPAVIRLPVDDPASAPPTRERPAVTMLFEPAKALPGFEVQAIRTDDTVVRASNRPNLSGPPRDGKAQWDFGGAPPLSKSSVAKFVFRGYRIQPIVWKNVALPPGIAPAK